MLSIPFLYREPIFRYALEKAIILSTRNILSNSVRLDRVWLESDFSLHISGFKADLKTNTGQIPFQIREIWTEGCPTHVFFKHGLYVQFDGLQFKSQKYRGIHATAYIRAGSDWFFQLNSEVDQLGLEDLAWMNPDNLEGSSGNLVGTISISNNAKNEEVIDLNIHIDQPGGRLQSKFFSALTPYLPAVSQKAEIQAIAGGAKLISYRTAKFNAKSIGGDKMKILLEIQIPEYNINLNLNIELRVDKQNSFFQVAQLLGLIKVKSI